MLLAPFSWIQLWVVGSLVCGFKQAVVSLSINQASVSPHQIGHHIETQRQLTQPGVNHEGANPNIRHILQSRWREEVSRIYVSQNGRFQGK